MDRQTTISLLRAHETEFRAAGVVSASVFGSTARGEPNARDVDIAVRLSESFLAEVLTISGGSSTWSSSSQNFSDARWMLWRSQCGKSVFNNR